MLDKLQDKTPRRQGISPSLARPRPRPESFIVSFSLAWSEPGRPQPGQVAWRAEREQRRGETGAQSDLDTESANTQERVSCDCDM